MTVAACILAANTDSAIRDVEGRPNARRLVETAWAGGALPVVVVAPDPDGAVAAVLAGSPAVLGNPAPPDGGPVAQIARAIDLAIAEIDGTTAALVWPARMGWVDAETITTLIEAHGVDGGPVLRPAFGGEMGWPVLVPVAHLEALRALPADEMPDALAEALAGAVPSRAIDTGDPGVTHDLDTARESLPPYGGPPEPPTARQHEWGAAVAAEQDADPVPPRVVG